MSLIRKINNSPQPMWNVAERPDRCQIWLSSYFKQQVLPLEHRYIQLLYRQLALLDTYLHSPGLAPEQKDELSAWLGELRRTLHSNAFVEKRQRDLLSRRVVPYTEFPLPKAETTAEAAAREATLSKSLWYLFGAASQEETEQNIHEFCRSREQQVAQIYITLHEITSRQALVQHLKQRQRGEDRTAGFLEEAQSYSQR